MSRKEKKTKNRKIMEKGEGLTPEGPVEKGMKRVEESSGTGLHKRLKLRWRLAHG